MTARTASVSVSPTRKRAKTAKRLMDMYERLYAHFGPRNWWPGDSALEIAVGAVLTQNTAWINVAKAIANLKEAGVLELDALRALEPAELAELIRPAGYYNLKEKRLRHLLDMFHEECGGDLESLWKRPLPVARELLLSVKGVGPETADSILLYAGGLPTFVIDAYTFRVLGRHGLAKDGDKYHDLQALFMEHLEPSPALFNEFHALIVGLGHRLCKKSNPLCDGCPLEGWKPG
jgi:endonuclease-3 related protein